MLFISRQYFDQDREADLLLNKLLQGEVDDADLVTKYIVLSGAYCLLRYIENCSGNAFAPHSLRVEYGSTCATTMNLDRRTAINLELICNAKTGKQKDSLFGVINNTKTVIGERLLRSNILRPSTDKVTINTRLDLVEDLLSNNRVFSELVTLLTAFPDLDKMLNGLVTVPKNITPKTARVGIDTLIFLKETLKLSPKVVDVITSMKKLATSDNSSTVMNPLLVAIAQNLRDPEELSKIEALIMDMITESTTYQKSTHVSV